VTKPSPLNELQRSNDRRGGPSPSTRGLSERISSRRGNLNPSLCREKTMNRPRNRYYLLPPLLTEAVPLTPNHPLTSGVADDAPSADQPSTDCGCLAFSRVPGPYNCPSMKGPRRPGPRG